MAAPSPSTSQAHAALSVCQFPFLDSDTLEALVDSSEAAAQGALELDSDLYDTLCLLDSEAQGASDGGSNAGSASGDGPGSEACQNVSIVLRNQGSGVAGNGKAEPNNAASGDDSKKNQHIVYLTPKSTGSTATGGNSNANNDADSAKSAQPKSESKDPAANTTTDGKTAAAGKPVKGAKPTPALKPGRTPKGTKPGIKTTGTNAASVDGGGENGSRIQLSGLRKNVACEIEVTLDAPASGKVDSSSPQSLSLCVYLPTEPWARLKLVPCKKAAPSEGSGSTATSAFRFVPRVCGFYQAEIQLGENNHHLPVSLSLLVRSPLNVLAQKHSEYMDLYTWAWSGKWTGELEDSALELLSVTDDLFSTLMGERKGPGGTGGGGGLSSLFSMIENSGMMGGSGSRYLEKSRKQLEDQMSKALVPPHDQMALGRAFEAVRELLGGTGMLVVLGGADAGRAKDGLMAGAVAFDKERMKCVSKEMEGKLDSARIALIKALKALRNDSKVAPRLRDLAVKVKEDTAVTEFQVFQQIEPLPGFNSGGGGGGLSSLFGGMLGGGGAESENQNQNQVLVSPTDLSRFPFVPQTKFFAIDYEHIKSQSNITSGSPDPDPGSASDSNQLQPQLQSPRSSEQTLSKYLLNLNEGLYSSAFMIGSNMLNGQYSVANNAFSRTNNLLQALLRQGCAYVTQEDGAEHLIGTIDNTNCWLDLQTLDSEGPGGTGVGLAGITANQSPAFVKRLKDNLRLLRQCQQVQVAPQGEGKEAGDGSIDLVESIQVEFQFAVNVGVGETIKTLRSYHAGDNWVGVNLGDFWQYLQKRGEFFVLQLFAVVKRTRRTVTCTKGGGEDLDGSATTSSSETGVQSMETAVAEVVRGDFLTTFSDDAEDDAVKSWEFRCLDTAASKPDSESPVSTSTSTSTLITRTLVAADFCHIAAPRHARSRNPATTSSEKADPPLSGSVYLATRYTSRKYRKYQPGFILAFLGQRYLKEQGFRYWDLGGGNSSPMMSYKFVVANPVSWPQKNAVLLRERYESESETVGDKAASDSVSASASGPGLSTESEISASASTKTCPGPVPPSWTPDSLSLSPAYSVLVTAEHMTGEHKIGAQMGNKSAAQPTLQKLHRKLMTQRVTGELKYKPNEAALAALKTIKEVVGRGLFEPV